MEKTELSLTEEHLGKLRQDLERVNVNRVKIQESIDQLERQQEQLDAQKIAIGGAIRICETICGKLKNSQELAKKAEGKAIEEVPEEAVENEQQAEPSAKVKAAPSGEPAKKKEDDEDEDN